MLKILLFCALSIISNSDALNQTLDCIKEYVNSFEPSMSPDLFKIFAKSFPNTIQTTIKSYNLSKGDQSTYIITGDIQAMWLRDSTNQLLPYIRMKKKCPHMRELAIGLIHTQSEMIMIDPYSNAFKQEENDKNKRPFYLDDISTFSIFGIQIDLILKKQFATSSIWERKFEIDSLASFLRLASEVHSNFETLDFINLRFIKALIRLMSTVQEQMLDKFQEQSLGLQFYTFKRNNQGQELLGGKILPSKNTGMVKSGFRPSDSPNHYPYNIPGNAMLCTYLQKVASIIDKLPSESIYKFQANILSSKMRAIANQIKESIYLQGIVQHEGKKIFAYEIDGLGNNATYDDANLPSLLSLPYLKFVDATDPIYQNTRQFLLSKSNRYYYTGNQADGIGSSHTSQGYIWPLAIITQILTSNSLQEKRKCLEILKISSSNNLIHESFNSFRVSQFTRPWFAWANSYFGEMIAVLKEEHPQLLM